MSKLSGEVKKKRKEKSNKEHKETLENYSRNFIIATLVIAFIFCTGTFIFRDVYWYFFIPWVSAILFLVGCLDLIKEKSPLPRVRGVVILGVSIMLFYPPLNEIFDLNWFG